MPIVASGGVPAAAAQRVARDGRRGRGPRRASWSPVRRVSRHAGTSITATGGPTTAKNPNPSPVPASATPGGGAAGGTREPRHEEADDGEESEPEHGPVERDARMRLREAGGADRHRR